MPVPSEEVSQIHKSFFDYKLMQYSPENMLAEARSTIRQLEDMLTMNTNVAVRVAFEQYQRSEKLEARIRELEAGGLRVQYHNNCNECGGLFWTTEAFASICPDCEER